eukprot:3791133-Prymnesium_polylepis.2
MSCSFQSDTRFPCATVQGTVWNSLEVGTRHPYRRSWCDLCLPCVSHSRQQDWIRHCHQWLGPHWQKRLLAMGAMAVARCPSGFAVMMR